MFKARLAEANLLKSGIDAVSQLISETTINLAPDGLSLAAMDPANVSLVDFRLNKSAFESFEVDKEQSIGISLEDLTQILKRAKADEPLELKLTDENRLELVLNGKRKFDIPLLDLGNRETKKPKLAFPLSIGFKSSLLESAIADTEIVGDAIIFEASQEKLRIRAEGDGRKAEIDVDKDGDEIIEIKKGEGNGADGTSISMFPLDYLKKMVKGVKMAETAELNLGRDYPMRLDIKDGDEQKRFELSYVLAPRIENE